MRTSYAAGHPQVSWRDGYRVIRKAGRYLVFPRAAFSEMMGWHGGRDGLVEIWNGMPFFSPLWSRTAHVTWLHHVHAEMWQMTLPPRLAAFGNFVESKLAPPIYHRTPMVTLSESSKRELVHDLGFRPDRVSVVSPGIDAHYTPGGEKSADATRRRGRPARAGEAVRRAGRRARRARSRAIPALEAVIVGEGYKREELEAQIHARARRVVDHASPGASTRTTKVDLYRRAWILASASAREGWGMTITEAAACGTPAVVSNVAGHADAVVDGETGILADGGDALRAGIDRLLGDDALRGGDERRGPRARGPVHVGGDRARHARGARRRRDRTSWTAGRPMKFTVIGHSCLRIETSGPTDPRRPVAARLVLLAVVVALPDGRRAVARGAGARLRVPHPPPLRSLPLPVDAAPRSRRARAGAEVRRADPGRGGAQPRLRRGDGAAARAGGAARAGRPGRVVPERPRRLGVRGRRRRRTCSSTSTTARSAAARCAAHPRGVRPPDLRVQELLVRAGLPGALHRRRSRRPRARHARHLPRRLGAGRRRSSDPRYGVPFGSMVAFLHPDSRSVNEHLVTPGEVVDAFRAAATAVDHRGGADGPGRQLELRRRLRARRRRLVRRPRPSTSTRSPRRSRRRSPSRPRAEAGVTLDYATFADYFDGFMHAFPPGVLGTLRAAAPGGVRGRRRRRCRTGCSTSAGARCTGCRRRRPTPPASSPSTRPCWPTPSPSGWCTSCTARCGSGCTCAPVARATTSPSGASSCRGSSGYLPLQRAVRPAPRRGHVAPAGRVARVGRRGARRWRHAVRARLGRPAGNGCGGRRRVVG